MIPPGGVPTLLPIPSITNSSRRGSTSVTDSSPRTQCGTITGSPRTFSSPSASIWSSIQSMERSSDSLPLRRWPKVSTK